MCGKSIQGWRDRYQIDDDDDDDGDDDDDHDDDDDEFAIYNIVLRVEEVVYGSYCS